MMLIMNLFISIATLVPFVVCYGTTASITTDHQQQQNNYVSTNSDVVMTEEHLTENRNDQDAKTLCDDASLSSALLSATSAASFNQANAQLRALNSSPVYQNVKNFDAIAESVAENRLKSQMLQGNIDIVSPNTLKQTSFLRSIMVPQRNNNHQIITTRPLQPIVITQPGAPPAQLYSGPPTIIKASPVLYKLKPSIIYQQEIINKMPAPLSLNPVYVKVYKPGKQINVPTQMIHEADDVFSSSSHHFNQNKYSHDAMRSTDYTIGRFAFPVATNSYGGMPY